jgi:hypothetical protein
VCATWRGQYDQPQRRFCKPVLNNQINTLAILHGLSSEGTLVNFAFFGSGEGATVGFQLEDSFGCFLAHVVDCVLITEPVAALDSVVGVVTPVVFVHVAEGCVDAALCGHGMGAGREQLRNTGSFKALLNKSKGCAETGATCADDDGVEGVIDYSVLLEKGILSVWGCTSASLPKEVLPTTAKPQLGRLTKEHPCLPKSRIMNIDI